MAQKKPTIADHIRRYAKEHDTTSPKQIIDGLAAEGIVVKSTAQISNAIRVGKPGNTAPQFKINVADLEAANQFIACIGVESAQDAYEIACGMRDFMAGRSIARCIAALESLSSLQGTPIRKQNI